MLAKLEIAGGFNEESDKILGCAETINMFVRQNPVTKKKYLDSFPGYERGTQYANGGVGRKMFSYKSLLFSVVGSTFYRGFSADGTLTTPSGFVSIAGNNKNQVMLVDGVDGYIYNTVSSVFTKITAAGFPGLPQFVLYMDGIFIVGKGGSTEFFASAENDGLTWDALDFAGIESKPDNLVMGAVLHRRIYLFGTNSTEVWYNAGTADFPFRRDNNLLLEYGCAAKGSVVVGFDRLIWLANQENGTLSVKMTAGSTPVSISNPALEKKLQNFATTSDAFANIYERDGNFFYEITFPTENKTYTYDNKTNLWFEKQTDTLNRFPAVTYARVGSAEYFLHYNDDFRYELKDSLHQYGEDTQPLIRITEEFEDEYRRAVRINSLTVDIYPGQGLVDDNGGTDVDPKIFMSYSKDGGFTYSNEVQGSIGRLGERRMIARWRRLGMSGGTRGGSWVFKFRFYNRTKCLIGDGVIDYEVLK